MRLSEAILLGSTLNPQSFEDYTERRVMSRVTRTCALGAALVAVGKDPALLEVEAEDLLWPWLASIVACPVNCNALPSQSGCVIVHLNDEHRWTRERIAEWVAKIEPVPFDELEDEPLFATTLTALATSSVG